MNGLAFMADLEPSWLFFAGVALLTTILVRMTYRRSRPTRGGRATASEVAITPSSANQPYRDLLGRLEAKEVDVIELAREATARLDNKIAILQRLLAEADAKIARLEQAAVRREEWESGKGAKGD